MSIAEQALSNRRNHETCADVAEFRRLKYFYGRMLSAQDMETEQSFFREKLKLHNRCLHGYGVVCGLLVHAVPLPERCESEDEKREKQLRDQLVDLEKKKQSPPPGTSAADLECQIEDLKEQLERLRKKQCKEESRTRLLINCGLALDCEGNELVVRRPLVIDLMKSLSAEDRKRIEQGNEDQLYISLCYCEQELDPVRPVLTDVCGAISGCEYGKLQDSVRVRVTVDAPESDERCGTCCEPCPEQPSGPISSEMDTCDDEPLKVCCEPCLLLARIDDFKPGQPLDEAQIHNEVRRPVSTYVPTTITGISWRHGDSYTVEEAEDLMGTDYESQDTGEGEEKAEEEKIKGLEVRFSRPVLASSFDDPGVLDTWVIEGGKARAGNIYHKAGKVILGDQKGKYVSSIFYQDTTDETLQHGDRVLIILRTEFILDHCCRQIAGEHVGGRVPVIEEYAKYGTPGKLEDCVIPPVGYGPWTSGNGRPSGRFESWFYIKEEERKASAFRS